MGETFEKITVTIERKVLNVLHRQLPPGSSPEQAILNALIHFIDDMNKVKLSGEVLGKIAARAAMDPIHSETELLKAFEITTSLDQDSFILHIDPVVVTPMLVEVAHGQGRSIAEVVRDYISHSAANGGFFTDHIPYRYLNLTNEQFKRLSDELGPVRDGSDLLAQVLKLKADLKAAKDALLTLEEAEV